MSATDAPAELPAPEEPAARGRPILTLVIAMLGLTLLAAGMGGGLGIKLANQVEDAVRAKETAEAAKPSPTPRYAGPTHLKKLEPIITNLAEPRDVWVRVEASIIFEDPAIDTDDVLAGKIAQDILAFLRTVSLAQIDGPSGMQHLREDLADRARIRSEGRVREVVLQTLVFG